MKPMSTTHRPAPPLGLAFIAGVLKKAGHYIQVIDCVAEAPNVYYSFRDGIIINGMKDEDTIKLIDEDVDIIGFSIMFSGNWIHNRKLIDRVGNSFPKALIIAGGEHVTACPEFCFLQSKCLDVCVLGEGEETILSLINTVQNEEELSSVNGIAFRSENNTIFLNARRGRIRDLNNIQRADWSSFPLRKYTEKNMSYGIISKDTLSLPILATRGCPYTCTFCSSPKMWGTRYFMRSPSDVADEMEDLINKYNVANFDFYDLTAIIKKDWIIELCNEIINRGLNITWQIPAGTRSEAIDSEVADWLYRSGCKIITYAPESGSKEVLKRIKKKVKLYNMLKSIRQSSNRGLNVKINFMIGFPGETHKDMLQSILFLIKASWYGVNDMAPATFSPYPGSELFEQLHSEGKIDLENDGYFIDLINSETFFDNNFYLFVFYSSNFIFRPLRFFKTMYNIATKRYESRGEMTLGELINRSKVKVIEIPH
jgi:radical SAM superfamily enzyme YgiQ (UPF0313 family)